MAHFPKVHSSTRAPRRTFSKPAPAEFRVEDQLIRGHLQRLSATGGYAVLDRNLQGGTLAEVEIPTASGPVFALVEFLERKGGAGRPSELAFRFVGLDDAHYDRLQSALKQIR